MLEDKISRYLSARYLRFEDEQIWFGKEQVVFYFVQHLVNEFLMNRQIFGSEYGAVSFLAGREAGHGFVERHGIPLKKLLTPVVEMSCSVLNTFGFGSFRTVKVMEGGFMVVAGKSVLAMNVKQKALSKEPIDFALGGVFAGALGFFSSKPIYSVEVKCCAQKNVNECVWVAGSEKSIIEYVEEFSPKQVGFAKSVLSEIMKVEKKLGKQDGFS